MDETQHYTVTFQRAIQKTLSWEGGYSNDPDDPGGETNWGIAKRWHPDVDIKNLSRDGAIAIYHAGYWMPMRLDALRDTRLAMKIFDTVVNQDRRIGPGALQGALILLGQNLLLDYKIGPVTIAAANSYRYPEALLEVYTVLRGMAYLLGAENIEEVIAMIRQRKDRVKRNIRGWMKRLELVGSTVLTTTLSTVEWVGALVFALVLASGCGVSQYTASTTASYEVTANGPRVFYNSNKDQQGFKADLEIDDQGKPKKFHVETTATTPEAAIAAALQSNLKFQEQFGEILKAVLPLITKAAAAGAK